MTVREKKRARSAGVPAPLSYALERLYQDQDRDWVIDTVPAVLAFVPNDSRERTYRFEIEHAATSGGATRRVTLALTWSIGALEAHDADVRARAKRMRIGRTAQREHVPELAGYGLALVAISVLLPGRRVVDMERWRSPDLLFDTTPGALRGVEVACRSDGGWGAVGGVREQKAVGLIANDALAEGHLSVWCRQPRVSHFCKVKP